jgi:hypothetical protein
MSDQRRVGPVFFALDFGALNLPNTPLDGGRFADQPAPPFSDEEERRSPWG